MVVDPDHPDVRLIVTDELAIKVDAVRELVGAAALRPADREVLRLSIWEELTNAEIATVLEIEPHAVTMRLARARKRMARSLGISKAPAATTPRVRTDPQPIGEGGEQ